MEISAVRYVRNGDVALAYQLMGDGEMDLTHVPTTWMSNLEVVWDNPLCARFLTSPRDDSLH